MNPIFIAEIKTQSPFGFKSKYPFISLMDQAISHGDWISAHTNALWGGDYDAISFVRNNTNKPILAKGIHGHDDDIKRALDHGATYVLVVDRLPTKFELLNKCLLELNRVRMVVEEHKMFPEVKFVYNTRNLRSGLPKKLNELEDYINTGAWICQASGIRTVADIHPKVNAFIVGENLVDFCKEWRKITP